MKKKLTVLFLCVAAVFVFTACGSSPVATVNDVKITQDQYEQYTNYMVAYYESMYTSYGMEFSMTDAMATSLQTSTIDALVYMEEMKQACADVDCVPTDDEIKDYVYKSIGATDEETYEQYMSSIESQYGMDKDMIIDVIGMGLYQENLENYLADKQDITFTKDQATKLYEAGPESYDNRTVSYILIQPDDTDATTDDDGNTVYTDDAWAAAKTKAEKVIAKLDDGDDFATLAEKYSDDSSTASDGGSISDSFTEDNTTYAAEFTAAAFKLTKVDQYTEDPVKVSSYGYFIIKCDGLQDANNDYDTLIQSIVDDNLSSLKSDALDTYMTDYGDKCDVAYYYGEKANSDEDETTDDSSTSTDSE